MNHRARPAAGRPYGVLIDGAELLRAMRMRGLTGAAAARKSKEIAQLDGGTGVSQATISHAMNGRRIHPASLAAINAVLRSVAPLDNAEVLILDHVPGECASRPRVLPD